MYILNTTESHGSDPILFIIKRIIDSKRNKSLVSSPCRLLPWQPHSVSASGQQLTVSHSFYCFVTALLFEGFYFVLFLFFLMKLARRYVVPFYRGKLTLVTWRYQHFWTVTRTVLVITLNICKFCKLCNTYPARFSLSMCLWAFSLVSKLAFESIFIIWQKCDSFTNTVNLRCSKPLS